MVWLMVMVRLIGVKHIAVAIYNNGFFFPFWRARSLLFLPVLFVVRLCKRTVFELRFFEGTSFSSDRILKPVEYK